MITSVTRCIRFFPRFSYWTEWSLICTAFYSKIWPPVGQWVLVGEKTVRARLLIGCDLYRICTCYQTADWEKGCLTDGGIRLADASAQHNATQYYAHTLGHTCTYTHTYVHIQYTRVHIHTHTRATRYNTTIFIHTQARHRDRICCRATR